MAGRGGWLSGFCRGAPDTGSLTHTQVELRKSGRRGVYIGSALHSNYYSEGEK